jgi:putative ABC transport system permease protein
MRQSAEPGARLARPMKFLPLIWAWLWRSPSRAVLGFLCVAIAFAIYGLALGMAASFYREAAARQVDMGSSFLLGALAVSAIGFALVLFLTTSATAQSVRQRLGEFAVLKAIGYSHRLILLLVAAETTLPCLAGAMAGLVAAKLLYGPVVMLAPALAAIPALIYTPAMLAAALTLALFAGTVSAVPASRLLRLEPAVALTGGLRATSGLGGEKRRKPQTAAAASPAPTSMALRLAEKVDIHLSRQILAVTWVGLSTLRYRLGGTRTVVIAVGIVAFVLLGGLSCAEGIRLGLLTSGDPARVVLSQINQPWEEDKLAPRLAELAAGMPGVARARDGAPLVDGEYKDDFSLTKRNNGNPGSINVVGVGPHWPEMAPEFRLLSGRMPRPGAKELIAGEIARRKFSGLDDNRVDYRGAHWRIVGTFVASPWWSAYLLGNAATLKAAGKRPYSNAILLRLTAPEAFEAFRREAARKLPPDIRIERETDNYARYWARITQMAAAFDLTYMLAGLAAFGAAAAMAQVMQVAAEERAREIAVLRALGFDGIAIALSLAAEGMLLSLLGALAGAAVVWLFFDGNLYNGAGNVFCVTVNLHLLLVAMGWGLVIAVAGILRPALRLARQTPIEALREV